MALSMCVIKMLRLICVHGCVRVAFLLSLIKISFVKYSSHIVQPTYWKCAFFSKPLSNLKYTQSCTAITSQFYKRFPYLKENPSYPLVVICFYPTRRPLNPCWRCHTSASMNETCLYWKVLKWAKTDCHMICVYISRLCNASVHAVGRVRASFLVLPFFLHFYCVIVFNKSKLLRCPCFSDTTWSGSCAALKE